MRLELANCVVREWNRDDKASLVRMANNRNVWRNLTDRFPHPYTESDADDWLSLVSQPSEPTHWAIEVDREACGSIGIIAGEGMHVRTALFGYWLGESLWGRGIMTTAAKSVSRYALDHFKLHRLEAPVFAWNPASMRVLEKAGFTREGILRRNAIKDGQVIDSVLYALTDKDVG